MDAPVLTQEEKTFFHMIRDIEPHSSLWGLAISNVAKEPEPYKVKELIKQLRSQASDNKDLMKCIIGEPAYFQLQKLQP